MTSIVAFKVFVTLMVLLPSVIIIARLCLSSKTINYNGKLHTVIGLGVIAVGISFIVMILTILYEWWF